MNLKEKYSQFKDWQKKPYQVAPLSQEEHTCATCGTSFQGNYCPRCGQSAIVGRYSLKTALLLFLDVWGLGNRSMFRTIRDLLLRPGYMIRDYLDGMQMAYFPPFKMFFLLITFSILVDSGLNIKGENRLAQAVETYEKGFDTAAEGDDVQASQEESSNTITEEEKKEKEFQEEFVNNFKSITLYLNDHQTIIMLVFLLVLSLPLYLFFRHCPAVPDFRYPEFFVAMLYINNLTIFVSIILGLFCVTEVVEVFAAYVFSIIALKQLSAYSYIRTFLCHAASFACLMFFIFLAGFVGIIIYGIYVGLVSAGA